MELEIITQHVEDTLQAEKLGATRVELVSAMKEGGLTPSYGTIKNVLEATNIPVQMMIRPHSYGFVYNEADWNVMKEDLSMIRYLGGKRIVFGCITTDGKIDEALLNQVIDHVPEFDITFHRAFDHVHSQEDAYHVLTKYKQHVKRILTSGGKRKAIDGMEELHNLLILKEELGGPNILVGSGVSPDNIENLHQKVQASEYHVGSGVRVNGNFSNRLDANLMKKITSCLL